jgi:hypothetical protein
MIRDPARFIDAAAQRGVQVRLTPDGRLDVTGPAAWLDALLPQIRTRRAELVRWVASAQADAAARIAARHPPP